MIFHGRQDRFICWRMGGTVSEQKQQTRSTASLPEKIAWVETQCSSSGMPRSHPRP